MISTGPVEISYTVTVPTAGWLSLDIPLSAFGAVNMADLIRSNLMETVSFGWITCTYTNCQPILLERFQQRIL